jgi:hypothetical protein
LCGAIQARRTRRRVRFEAAQQDLAAAAARVQDQRRRRERVSAAMAAASTAVCDMGWANGRPA